MNIRYDAYELTLRLHEFNRKCSGTVIELPHNGTLMIYKDKNIFDQHVLSPLGFPQVEYILTQDDNGYYLKWWDGQSMEGKNAIEPK